MHTHQNWVQGPNLGWVINECQVINYKIYKSWLKHRRPSVKQFKCQTLMISYVKSSGDREILGLMKWLCNTIKAQGFSNLLPCHPQQDSACLISSLRFVLFMLTKLLPNLWAHILVSFASNTFYCCTILLAEICKNQVWLARKNGGNDCWIIRPATTNVQDCILITKLFSMPKDLEHLIFVDKG